MFEDLPLLSIIYLALTGVFVVSCVVVAVLAALAHTANKREEQSRRAERLQRCEDDIWFFARYYFPEFFTSPTPAFHQELVDLVQSLENPRTERDMQGLVAAIPHGYGTTTLFSFLIPMRWLLLRKRHFIVLVGSDIEMAAINLAEIRHHLLNNPRIRADFGDLLDDYTPRASLPVPAPDRVKLIVKHRDASGRVVFSARLQAKAALHQMRGLRHGSHRPDALILDAPDDVNLDDPSLIKPADRVCRWNWLTKVAVPALDPSTGILLAVGAVDDSYMILGRLLKAAKEAEQVQHARLYRRVYRAEQDDGALLWPERFPQAMLDDRARLLGTAEFNRQYNNMLVKE